MEKEVKVSESTATLLSLLCGVLLFCGYLTMTVTAQIATQNNQNVAIVSAMANGTIPLSLVGSYCIYKERLSLMQVVGSLTCLAGILTLTLSVLKDK